MGVWPDIKARHVFLMALYAPSFQSEYLFIEDERQLSDIQCISHSPAVQFEYNLSSSEHSVNGPSLLS